MPNYENSSHRQKKSVVEPAHDMKAKALQDALLSGEQSGVATEFDSDEFLAKSLTRNYAL